MGRYHADLQDPPSFLGSWSLQFFGKILMAIDPKPGIPSMEQTRRSMGHNKFEKLILTDPKSLYQTPLANATCQITSNLLL